MLTTEEFRKTMEKYNEFYPLENTGAMFTAYIGCRHKTPEPEWENDIWKVHEHIYGSKSKDIKPCRCCQKYLEMNREDLQRCTAQGGTIWEKMFA